MELHQTTWCADRAIDFIRDHAAGGGRGGRRCGRRGGRHEGEPWLFSVNIFDPHGPFDAPFDYESRYDPASLPPPLFRESDVANYQKLSGAMFQNKPVKPGERQQRNKASYYGMVELIDDNVGRMLDALESTGQRENTVVVFTSDHGEMLGDHGLTAKGCRFYEGAVRVPLIVSCPSRFQEGLIAQGLTELTDLAPTISELAGLPDVKTHGKSLVSILRGKADPTRHHEYVRCEFYDTLDMKAPYAFDEHEETWATMYRNDRWKLVVYHTIEFGELYDLENDPDEFVNLWDDPDAQCAKRELMKKSFDASVRAIDIGPQLIGRY
jgi:arylsulfatase A-like enzyme